METIQERIIGSVIGLAIGDALGAPLEGLSSDIAREKIELITGKKAVDFWSEPQENIESDSDSDDPALDFMENKWGVHGIYTDDTQYMLCMIQSILETGNFSAERTRDVFASLRQNKGPVTGFGLFRGTGERGRAAIEMMVKKQQPQLCGQYSAGNGGAMRMGPLGAYYYNNEAQLISSAIESSLLTHRDPRGISAAVAMAIAVSYLCKTNEEDFNGKEYLVHVAKKCREAETTLFRDYKEYLLLPVVKNSTRKDPQANTSVMHQFSDAILWCSSILPHGFARCCKEIGRRAAIAKHTIEDDSNKKSNAKTMHPTGGFVFCSVLTALVCSAIFDEFAESLQSVLELGGDADTAGAMVGTLMGARLGYKQIPEKWRENVLNADPMLKISQHLAELATKDDKSNTIAGSCCNEHTIQHLVDMESMKFIDE